jgi:hypothetical protein
MWESEHANERQKESNLVMFESISYVLGSFSADCIVAQVECDECLCAKVKLKNDREKESHLIFFESIS